MKKRKPQITITEAERGALEATVTLMKGMKSKSDEFKWVTEQIVDRLQHLLDRSKRDDK